jgi:hypothetical protein
LPANQSFQPSKMTLFKPSQPRKTHNNLDDDILNECELGFDDDDDPSQYQETQRNAIVNQIPEFRKQQYKLPPFSSP